MRFLLLATRPEVVAADEEYEAFLRFTGLREDQLVRRRLDREPLGEVDPDDWDGLVLGGSPFTVSDAAETKSSTQRRVEAELRALLEVVVARDVPFFGACYGIGTLGSAVGAVVDKRYGEPVGSVTVTLTDAGRRDPLTGGLPAAFDAFVGHKEAISALPDGAVRLAGSPGCPVQAFRVGRHVYATQFHPELDGPGLATRIATYQDAGYFPREQAEELIALARRSVVEHPPLLLRRFVERYGAVRRQASRSTR